MKKTLLLAFCYLLANTANSQNENGRDILPQMALIKLKIQKQGENYTILVKDVTVIKSESKNYTQLRDNDNKNGLLCLILDKNEAIIDSLKINDPLQTRYEYPNEDGTIGSKVVELDEKDVVLRCSYNPQMQYLRVLKFTDKKEKKTLVTLKLPAKRN